GHTTGFWCVDPTPVSVEKITPTGVAWSWTSPNPDCLAQLAATPDGGVVLGLGNSATYREFSSTGALRWTYQPTPPRGSIWSTPQMLVDTNGNVTIPFNYQYTTPENPFTFQHGVAIDFVNRASGTAVFPELSIE